MFNNHFFHFDDIYNRFFSPLIWQYSTDTVGTLRFNILGSTYFAIGFPRTAFLPDTERGRKLLALLEKAFNAGHTFTVNRAGDISWATIPHRSALHMFVSTKTERHLA